MGNGTNSTRRATELPFDDSEVTRGRLVGVRNSGGRHGPTKPADAVAPGAAFGSVVRTGAAVMTGADAAGGEINAGANVGLGDGDGFGGATCAASCTDDHSRPYHGWDASAAAAAADADATGVGDNVTYGTCPGNT